jgi:predicted ATPase
LAARGPSRPYADRNSPFFNGLLKDSSVLLLGTYRDAEVKSSSEVGKFIGELGREGSTLPLGGLSQAEIAELVEAKAGSRADDGLVERLYEATDGNPLFVDGVVQLMLADGSIDRTREYDQGFKIPDGVRESIRRRIAALSEQHNSVLVIAAVIGNEFDLGLLRRVSGKSPEELVNLL